MSINVLDPVAAAKEMKDIRKQYIEDIYDPEVAHIKADQVLLMVLMHFGADNVVNAWMDIEDKYYA